MTAMYWLGGSLVRLSTAARHRDCESVESPLAPTTYTASIAHSVKLIRQFISRNIERQITHKTAIYTNSTRRKNGK